MKRTNNTFTYYLFFSLYNICFYLGSNGRWGLEIRKSFYFKKRTKKDKSPWNHLGFKDFLEYNSKTSFV